MKSIDRGQAIGLRNLNSIIAQSRQSKNLSVQGLDAELSVGNPIVLQTPDNIRYCTARITDYCYESDGVTPLEDGFGYQLYQWIEENETHDGSGNVVWQDSGYDNARGSVDLGGGNYLNPAREANRTALIPDVRDSPPFGTHVLMLAGVADSDGGSGYNHVFYAPAGTAGTTTTIQWGKVQSTPTNQSGATQLAVSVKACNSDGSGVTGSAFNVYTPILSARDTAIFTGDVVAFVATAGGVAFTIVSDCFDDCLGSLRLLYTSGARVPNGWTEITSDLAGMFPMTADDGVSGFGDNEVMAVGAGPRAGDLHTHTAHSSPTVSLNVTTQCIFVTVGSGLASAVTNVTVSTTNLPLDNNHSGAVVSGPVIDRYSQNPNSIIKPPRYAVRVIQRTS